MNNDDYKELKTIKAGSEHRYSYLVNFYLPNEYQEKPIVENDTIKITFFSNKKNVKISIPLHINFFRRLIIKIFTGIRIE